MPGAAQPCGPGGFRERRGSTGGSLPGLASVYIVARDTKRGRSFHVKYRLHGRYGKIEHAGAFPTMKQARARAAKVGEWIAEARDPRVELERFLEPNLTVLEAGRAWLRGRRSIAPSTHAGYRRRVERIGADLDLEAARLTWRDVNDWIDKLGVGPATVSEYVTTLRAILDHAGVDPNPARDRRVELPRRDRTPLVVPTADEVARALSRVTVRFRPVLVLIEQTGLRVSEACGVRPEHIEPGRLLVPTSKTGRPRWAPLPRWLGEALEPPWPVNRNTVHNALKAACDDAGVNRFGPHALRHRRASLWSAQGVPPAQAAAWLGHTVETYLRAYTHVVAGSEIEAHRLAALLR